MVPAAGLCAGKSLLFTSTCRADLLYPNAGKHDGAAQQQAHFETLAINQDREQSGEHRYQQVFGGDIRFWLYRIVAKQHCLAQKVLKTL